MSLPAISDRFILQKISELAARIGSDSYGIVLVNQLGDKAGQLEAFEFSAHSRYLTALLLEKIQLNAQRAQTATFRAKSMPVYVALLEQLYDRRVGFIWFSVREQRIEVEASIGIIGREIETYLQDQKRLSIYKAISNSSARIGASESPMMALGTFMMETLFPDHLIIWERDREFQSRQDGYKAIYTSDGSEVRILRNRGIVGYCFEEDSAFSTERAIRVDEFLDSVTIQKRFSRSLANEELLKSRGLHSGIFIPITFDLRVDALVAVMFRRPFGATNIEQEVLCVIVELFKGVLRYRTDRRFIDRIKSTYKRVAPHIDRTVVVAERIHQMKDDIVALRNIFSMLSGQTEKEKEIIARGRHVSRQLAELTSSLKDSIGQDSDIRTIRLRTRKFALISLIDTLIAKYSDDIQRKAIVTRIDVPPDLQLAAPYSLVERIMENGITNSIKALAATTHRRRILTIAALQKDKIIEIRISDTGYGVEESVLDYVFEPFFTTNDQDSSGLGLFLVSSAAADLGGSARAASNWGRGFDLIIELPASISQIAVTS